MYIRVDEDGRVIEIYEKNYTGLLFADWKPDGNLMDDRYVYRYKYEDGVVIERTEEEMDTDYEKMPKHPPSDTERIAQLEEELKAAKILLGLEV